MKSLLEEGGVFAFPFAITETPFCSGMTLRDYFAAKAITDICDAGMSGRITAETVASVAYEIADAMIKARNKK